MHPVIQQALKPFVKRTSADRFAAVAEAKPTGDGRIVLDAVVQELGNMVGFRAVPFLAFEPLKEDLIARAEMGEKKYGTKLRIRNGRKAAVDCYQEVLDGVMYAMQARLEGDHKVGRHFEALMQIAAQIAAELNVR